MSENKIVHVKTTKTDKGESLEHYTYNFSMIGKLNEDDGSKYGGLNVHDEIVQLIREQFYWNLVKFAYNLDMEKDEDALIFMQKIYGESFKDMTLEEFKALSISELK